MNYDFLSKRCNTLLDAIELRLTNMEINKLKKIEKSLVIVTDGLENASTEYTKRQSNNL